MVTYRKRNESSVVTSVLGYLQTLENLGKIAFYNRQQAGSITFQRGGKFSKVRLGREGVADVWVITKNGLMVWIECKVDSSSKQSPAQIEFETIVEECGHQYWIVTDLNTLANNFEMIGVA